MLIQLRISGWLRWFEALYIYFVIIFYVYFTLTTQCGTTSCCKILCLVGILFANGESWKELRYFALTTLKDFGKRLSHKILAECSYLIQVIEEHKDMEIACIRSVKTKTNLILLRFVLMLLELIINVLILSTCWVTGEPFDTALPINYATANIIFSVVYGCRFDYNEPIFTKMVKRANHATCVTGSASVQVCFFIPPPFFYSLLKKKRMT